MHSYQNKLYECFEKNGLRYECLIAPQVKNLELDEDQVLFDVTLKIPVEPTYVRFSLSSSHDGHWIPTERKTVDPWIADAIGRIILDNF